jgi:hypothetical protein
MPSLTPLALAGLLAAGLSGCVANDRGYVGYDSYGYAYDSDFYAPFNYDPSYGLGFSYYQAGGYRFRDRPYGKPYGYGVPRR